MNWFFFLQHINYIFATIWKLNIADLDHHMLFCDAYCNSPVACSTVKMVWCLISLKKLIIASSLSMFTQYIISPLSLFTCSLKTSCFAGCSHHICGSLIVTCSRSVVLVFKSNTTAWPTPLGSGFNYATINTCTYSIVIREIKLRVIRQTANGRQRKILWYQAIKSKWTCCFKTAMHDCSFDTRKKIWNENVQRKFYQESSNLPWSLNSLLFFLIHDLFLDHSFRFTFVFHFSRIFCQSPLSSQKFSWPFHMHFFRPPPPSPLHPPPSINNDCSIS